MKVYHCQVDNKFSFNSLHTDPDFLTTCTLVYTCTLVLNVVLFSR